MATQPPSLVSSVDSKTITRPRRPHATILPEATPETPTAMDESSAEKPAPSPSALSNREERRPRQRQQTMTMQSNLVQTIHDAFKKALEANPADPVAEAERRVLALVTAKENEWQAKNEKLSQMLVGAQKEATKQADQADADIRFLKATIADYEKSHGGSPLPMLPARTPTGIPGSRSTHQLDTGSANLLVVQLKTEKEHLADEAERLHGQYSSLYKTYEKQRSAIEILRKELETKEKSENELTQQLATLDERYKKLHENATQQINKANEMILDLKKSHDEDTLGLRMSLKKKETELEATQKQLAIKKKEADELSKICAQLIERAEKDMGESMTSSIASTN